ncbi:PIG-P [Trinorchestia longiramus]|nr:PIG-P [Trinorchestia longiramus]
MESGSMSNIDPEEMMLLVVKLLLTWFASRCIPSKSCEYEEENEGHPNELYFLIHRKFSLRDVMAPQQTPAPLAGRAYYGFVLYVGAWACIACYLTWALVPHEYLHELGITYLPHKFWALALPCIIVIGVLLFITLIYPGINLLLAVPPHDIRTLQDSHTLRSDLYEAAPHSNYQSQHTQNYCGEDDQLDSSSGNGADEPTVQGEAFIKKCSRESNSFNEIAGDEDTSCVPPVYDLHISDVCQMLYGVNQ